MVLNVRGWTENKTSDLPCSIVADYLKYVLKVNVFWSGEAENMAYEL
jgi:hypothetical protein